MNKEQIEVGSMVTREPGVMAQVIVWELVSF